MARLFNGTTNKIEVTDNAALTLPAAGWTIALRFYVTAFTAGTYPRLLSWGAYGTTSSVSLNYRGTDRVLQYKVQDADDNNSTDWASSELSLETWYHVAMIHDGSTVKIYVDGNLTSTRPSIALGDINHGGNLTLGVDPLNPGNGYLSGRLAEVAKWDRAITGDEIAALAGGASPAFFPVDRAWYLPMKEDLRERDAVLTITNTGTVLVAHPTVADPFTSPAVMTPIQSLLAG